MEMILPNNYVEIEEDEMMYLDGGIVVSLVLTIIGGYIIIRGGSLTMRIAFDNRYYALVTGRW